MLTGAEFARWQAWMEMEPDVGTRLDHLCTALGHLLTRIETVMGGRPPKIGNKLVDWTQ